MPRLAGSVDRLPHQRDVEDRLLRLLHAYGRPVEPRETYRQLADEFGLTQDQRHASYPSRGGEPAWHKLVQFARQRLVGNGWLDGSQRGLWSLTPEGRRVAELRAKGLTPEELGL
jgi:restriction endonuclease Mrr